MRYVIRKGKKPNEGDHALCVDDDFTSAQAWGDLCDAEIFKRKDAARVWVGALNDTGIACRIVRLRRKARLSLATLMRDNQQLLQQVTELQRKSNVALLAIRLGKNILNKSYTEDECLICSSSFQDDQPHDPDCLLDTFESALAEARRRV